MSSYVVKLIICGLGGRDPCLITVEGLTCDDMLFAAGGGAVRWLMCSREMRVSRCETIDSWIDSVESSQSSNTHLSRRSMMMPRL